MIVDASVIATLITAALTTLQTVHEKKPSRTQRLVVTGLTLPNR